MAESKLRNLTVDFSVKNLPFFSTHFLYISVRFITDSKLGISKLGRFKEKQIEKTVRAYDNRYNCW